MDFMKATAVREKLFFFFSERKRKKSCVTKLAMVFLENEPYY